MRSLVLVAIAACNQAPSSPAIDAGADGPEAPHQFVTITATTNSTRFVTREHMLAAAEMQVSGEPFAQAMGRDLAGFSRDQLPTDLYADAHLTIQWTDLAGFSTAVESYEYSKQPMNSLAFESMAGTSLAYGPLVNTDGAIGAAATAHLATLVQHYAHGSNAFGRFVFAPTATNPLGWPGIWPTEHVFASFDPAIDPTSDIALGCIVTSDDDPDGATGSAIVSGDYECDATTLHLRNRGELTITPGADGFSGWKYGLWVLNYLQIMHDPQEAPVTSVDDVTMVGQPGVQVYLGSSDIEGFQAQLLISMIDNRAEDWLKGLSTTDGATLSGFASVDAALAYDYTAPLRWFPHAIAVTETNEQPSYALASPDSELLDLVGLLLSYAEIYALTDTTNSDVGGAQSALAFFDGDPFDTSVRDRALAMINVALIDLDRLHTDPASGILVDDVAMPGATPERGHTISTTSVAYSILGFRNVLRSLGGQLELYSNNTPDTATASTPFEVRVDQMLRAHAQLLYDHLTDPSGRAYSGWDVGANAPTDQLDTLDAHAAAVRGLFASYLATGDVRFRDRAIAVFDRMDAMFWDRDGRIYAPVAAPVDDIEYTPLRFALVQSALRDMYELVATRPGEEARVPVLEDRVGRINKLVLNGWDDRNGNRLVEWPDECANVVDGLPRGGLQMAERTLTGELGTLQAPLLPGDQRIATSDREHDCVPEIDDAHLPAALADSVSFHLARQ